MRRRELITAALALPATAALADAHSAALAALRAGGLVVALRHALAPGTFDPPGFRIGDCSTQRNLDPAGRAQAQRIGTWFRSQGLAPAAVRASPWCRCVDTAMLAFGRVDIWPALGSPHGSTERANAERLPQLQQRLLATSGRSGGFEVWVTHQLVIAELSGASTASGEALLLRAAAGEQPQLLARLKLD